MLTFSARNRVLFCLSAAAVIAVGFAASMLWQNPEHHFVDAFPGYTPVVDVTIFGKKQRFILDTGAPLSVLDEKFRNQLRECPFVKASVAEFHDNRLYYPPPANGPGLGLSDCPFVVCADLSAIASQLKTEVDGILGVDAIRNYLVVFDPELRTISMFRNASLRGKSVPFHYDSQLSPIVRGAIGNQPMEFLLDTGSQSTVDVLAEDFEILRQSGEIYGPFGEYKIMGFDGSISNSQLGRCRKLTVFGTDSCDCVAMTSSSRSLGMPYFWRGKLSIDFPRSKVSFEPNSHFSAIDRSDSLSMGLRSCDDGYLVSSISKEGVGFRLGMREGDIITKAAGNQASELTQASLCCLLMFTGNHDVVLTVLRDGKQRDFLLSPDFK